MIADLYLRKSNEDDGHSVKRQERDLWEDLAGEGIEVGEVFVDPNLSASVFATKARKDYPRLVAKVQGGRCQMVAIWESSRGSRTASEWLSFLELCKANGTLIRVQRHRRTYDPRLTRDWETLAQDGIKAHGESLTLSDRTRDGKRDAARDGKPAGAKLYGYLNAYEKRLYRGRMVDKVVGRTKVDEEASNVIKIFTDVAANKPILEISRQTGLPPWHIRQIVRNPAYLGLRVHQDKTFGKAAWQPIVDEVLFNDANAVLDSRRSPRGSELKSLLTRVPRCGREDCSGVLINVGRDQRGKMAYSCNGCRRNTIQAQGLEVLVESAVLTRLEQPSSAYLFRPVASTAEITEAQTELSRLERRLAEFRAEGRKPDGLSAAAVAEAERGLAPLIEAAAAKVRRLTTPPALHDLDGADVRTKWAGYSMRRRREVVIAVVELVVDQAVRGRPYFDASRLDRSRWIGDELTWGDYRLCPLDRP